MKKNFHKSCGNCQNFTRMKYQHNCKNAIFRKDRGTVDFGGLCELYDSRGGPQCKMSKCKLWKGIKYDKIKWRRKMKEQFRSR